MRRVLLIHYHFLPVHNVAVKHLLGYARYLPLFGWQPLVLTHDWRQISAADGSWGLSWEPELESDLPFEIHRVAAGRRLPLRRSHPSDSWPVRKVRSLAHVVAGDYPDDFMSWARPAVTRGIELARQQRVDAIVSYCPPETNHVVANRIARALGVPWVPYFGDLSGFFLAPHPSISVRALISRSFRRRWLARAAALAAVSPYMVDYLAHAYRKRAALIVVGFEPREFDRPGNSNYSRQRFLISHVGSLYPGNQRPEVFLNGLDLFLRTRPDAGSRIEIRFVGSKCEDTLRELVRGRPCERVVTILPKVKSAAAVSMISESDALLIFNCSAFRDHHGTLSYPSKMFEAMGARRPILAVPADGDWVDELLARTGAGVSADTDVDVARVIDRWYAAWHRTRSIPYDGDDAQISAFTHERQTQHLAALLDSVALSAQPSRGRSAAVAGPRTSKR